MQIEEKIHRDGSKKFYLINDDGQAVKTLFIGKMSNILKHI